MVKMRCSMRESHILHPSMFTSTPISKRRIAPALNFFENSPIITSNDDLLSIPKQLIQFQNQKKEQISIFKVLGTQKIPLIKEKRKTSFKKSASFHPPMVVISDSEEEVEVKPNIFSEVTLIQSSASSRRKSVKMNISQQKENAKRVRNRNTVTSLKENLLSSDMKKSQKRISRVDTIIDEIMKERKSTILSPSPVIKMKSEHSVDAIVEENKNDLESRRVTRSSVLTSQDLKNLKEKERRLTYVPNILGREGATRTKAVEVTGKLKDIGNIDKISNIRRTRARLQNVIKKEDDIQYQEDDGLKVVAEQPMAHLKLKNNCNNLGKKDLVKKSSNCEDIVLKNGKSGESIPIPKISPRDEALNENLPVFYNQEEIDDNEWNQVNGQNGVFVKKNFRTVNLSNGFVKIEAKCTLQLRSVKSQIFSVAEGRGVFAYDNDHIKVKIGPGQTFTIPAGFPCKIINSGVKKNLVFSYVKVCSE